MRSVVTSGALVAALVAGHAAFAAPAKTHPSPSKKMSATSHDAAPKAVEKDAPERDRAAAAKPEKGGARVTRKSDRAEPTEAKREAVDAKGSADAREAKEAKKGTPLGAPTRDARAVAKADKVEKKKPGKRGAKDDDIEVTDDAELVQGLDPKILAEDAQEIAEEQAERKKALVALHAIQKKHAARAAERSAALARLEAALQKDEKDNQAAAEAKDPVAAADQPVHGEEVHVDDLASNDAPAATSPKVEDTQDKAATLGIAKASTKDTVKNKAVTEASADATAPIADKIVKASTRAERGPHAKHAAPKPPCLRPTIEVLSHLNEDDHFALTRCDGSLAPEAVERLSIAARPGSAKRPESSTADLAKKKDAVFAPGIRHLDPTLVERLQSVVDHFTKDGKAPTVHVVSGYRPNSVGSYHAIGRALDFRLEGVKNEELVAFCKTLGDIGCGYYPNSVFIHMDVRDSGAGHVTWIDASGPGEKPHYVSAWPAPPSEISRQKAPADEGLAKLDPTLPALPADEHPAAPIAAEATGQGATPAAAEKDLGARAGAVDGVSDDETR